jgi:two-component system LytT family response regulator
VFLDVHVPSLGGFDIVRRIRNKPPPEIVFVTACDGHAVRAFEVGALDYLIKPFDRDRIGATLDRARKRLGGAGMRGASTRSRIIVRSRGRILPLQIDEIDWLEAADNYVRVHTARQTHVVRETLAALEGRLGPHRFVRVHRQVVVNAEAIAEIRPTAHGDEVELRTGERVPVGRTRRNSLRRLFER